jgi:peroxiredoxin
VPRPGPFVGLFAPDFTPSTSTAGEKVTLFVASGQTVLARFLSACVSRALATAELCEMRDDHEQFETRGVTVLPISVDSTYSLKEYKAKHPIPRRLSQRLSTRGLAVVRRPARRRFYSNRAYFLIDGDGIIRWKHVEETQSHRRDDASAVRGDRRCCLNLELATDEAGRRERRRPRHCARRRERREPIAVALPRSCAGGVDITS